MPACDGHYKENQQVKYDEQFRRAGNSQVFGKRTTNLFPDSLLSIRFRAKLYSRFWFSSTITMDCKNKFNIYRGPHSMVQYFDPDYQPLLPLVELPDRLNPLRGDNVRIYAKMMTALPAQNIKALPGELCM